MATLRDLGLTVNTDDGRANILAEQDHAAGMGSLRRGWETGRIGTELNPLRTQALDAKIAGDAARQAELDAQVSALEQRQQRYQPQVSDLRQINGVGDALSYGAGQVGQGVASMLDPMAASAGLGVVGRVAGAIPHPIAKGIGLAAQAGQFAIPYMMSKEQLTGEFIGEAQRDKELMARTAPQGLRDMAGNYGAGAAVLDSALPGIVGRQVSGLSRAGSTVARQGAMGAGAKAGLNAFGEGVTEGLQAEGSQYARGLLNPNRDTSEDNWDTANNFAGGLIGGAPFSAAGALANAGHNRLDGGIDVVKNKAGEVVDMAKAARESDTGQKVERSIKELWESGKAKTGETIDLAKQKATDFATGEDGSVSMENAVDNAYEQYERVKLRREEKNTLDAGFPEGFTDLPPAQQATWLTKDDATKREVIDQVLGRSKDPEAQAHIAALQAGTDPAAFDNALDFARQVTREESTTEMVKEAAESSASWVGELAGKAARGVAGMGMAAAKGAMRGATGKRNAQSGGITTTSYEDWQARRAAMNPPNTVAEGVMSEVNSGVKGTMAEKAKEDSYRRAVMAGEYLASRVKPKRGVAPNPQKDDFMRTLGFEISEMADSWGLGQGTTPTDPALIARQKPALWATLDSMAVEMNAVLGEEAKFGLEYLEQAAGPRAAPMFEFLRERLMTGETPAGRTMRDQALALAKREVANLIPRKHFDEVMRAGAPAMDAVFKRFQKIARGRAERGDRELVDEVLGADTVNRIMEVMNGLDRMGESEEVVEEGVSDFDKAAGEKKLSKGSSAIYGFGAKLAPRTGGDIFARTKDMTEEDKINAAAGGEDITQRPKLFKGTTDGKTGKVTGTDLLPSGDNMLDFKIAEMEKRVGYVRGERTANPTKDEKREEGWNDSNKGWGVDTISAHDAMEGFGPTRKLALYRDYLRQESSSKKDTTQTPEQQELAKRSTFIGNLLGRIVAHDKKPSGPSSQWTERQNQEWQAALKLAKETGHDGEESMDVSEAALDNHQVKTALAEAEAFFRERHIVRAYSMTDNDPSALGLDKAMEMEKKAKKIENSVRLAADGAERRGDDEAANKLRSDANLLYFTRDGEDFPIAVRDLVLWARKAKDYQGQTQDEDDMNRSEANENGRYADSVWSGISEFGAQHADYKVMPYKINPAGEKEYFEVDKKGALVAVPDSLMLQNKPFYQARNDGDLSYKFESVLGIRRKHQAADGPNRGRNPEDVRDRASNQRATNRAADKNDDYFTAEQREEMDPEVDDRVQKSTTTKGKLHRVGDRGYMENGVYIPIDQSRASGGEFGYSTDRSGQVAPEPKITEDDTNQNRTPLDFSKGQDPKAEADENTNQSWFTKQTMPRFESPTSAMHGMSSAKYNAANILRVMMGNQVQEGDGVANGRKEGGAREGDRLVVTMLRTALEPDNKRKGVKYEAYRIAPLIHLVSNNKEAEGKGFRQLSNVEYFLQAGATPALVNIVQRGAAQVLIRPETNITDPDRLTLARQLLGNEKLPNLGLTKKLQDFLNAEGGRVNEEIAVNWGDPSLMPEDVAPKVQPIQRAAPKTMKEKAVAKADTPAAPAAPTAFDDDLADILNEMDSGVISGFAKPTKIAEGPLGQAAADRARNATVDAETKRQIRNMAAPTGADKARDAVAEMTKLMAEVAQDLAAGRMPSADKLAAMQKMTNDQMVANAKARLQTAKPAAAAPAQTAAPAAPVKPAAAPAVKAPSVSTAPEGYVAKTPTAATQAKIDAAVKPADSSYHAAIRAAIQRNTIWRESGDETSGPGLDAQNKLLTKWLAMSEAEAKAAALGNNSANAGAIVRALQEGSTGSPLGKPSGAKRNNMVASVSAELASSREIMRSLGFKSAPEGFADVSAKLLSDPDQDLAAFVKDSAKALSHLLVTEEGFKEFRAALQGDAWFAERAKIVARLVKGGMQRGDALMASYRVIVEQALTGELIARTKNEKNAVTALWQMVKDFVSRFKAVVGSAQFEDLIRNKLNELVEKSKGPIDLKKGYTKVTFQQAVDGDPVAAEVLAHMATNPNISITGSIVLAANGNIYRKADNMLHDLDFIVSGSKADAEAHMRKAFPNAVQVYDFKTSNGKVDSYLVPPKGATIENIVREYGEKGKVLSFSVMKDGKEIGRTWNDANGESKSGVSGTFVDFFTETNEKPTSTIPFTVSGKSHTIKGMPPGSIFDAKLSMSRDKDISDYMNFVPAVGRKFNKQENAQTPDGEHNMASAGEMAEARAWLEKVAPGTVLEFIEEAGFSGEFVETENLVRVSRTAAAGILGTTYHEGLHKFFAQFVRSNPELQKKFQNLVDDEAVKNRIHALLEGYPAAQAQLVDGEERLAYAFQFWKAGLLRIDNENRSILQKVGALFRRVFGMVRDSEHALAIFQAFDEGKLAKPSVAAQVIAKQLGKGTMALKARRGMDGLMQGLGAAVLPAEVILGSNEHSPTARKLGAIMFTNPGEESAGGGQIGYLNAKRSQGKAWANKANTIFENMAEVDITAVQKYMQAQTDVADIKMTAHREAVTALRTTMKEFHTYLRESGLKIGEVDKYYPVVWSIDALHKNKDKFVDMLVVKYPKELNATDGDLKAAAERIHTALIDRNGVDNKGLKANREEETGIKEVVREDGVLSPFFAGQEGRTLWWLDGKDSEAYQSKSITHTMSQYFHQGVRAAEYHRRFGESGIKLEAMIKQIRAEITNASYKLYPPIKDDGTGRTHTVKLGSKNVQSQMPSDAKLNQGADRDKWAARQMRDISMSIGAIEGTLGKDISPNMRKFNSYMIAYQNVRLLPYMIFSSFTDPLAQVARGAPMKAAMEIFTRGMSEVFRSWADMFRDMPKARQKDEWTKLAEHIGAVEVAMFNHHVADEYSSVYMSPVARKINETLFKMNGMEAWDRANRTMAVKWAVRFIEQHAGLPDKNHSARWLEELGLSASTVPLNADGQLITTAEELSIVQGISPQLARIEIAKVHAALNRWVEGAVISPNAAQRPGWSSDPNYASVFHLKQFAYSFQQTIMQRAVNELEHGNLTPITALAGFVPTMLVADLMKGLVQGAGTLPAHMAGMDAGERITRAMERSGVMGTGDIASAALQDWSSLGGPAFEQVVDGLRDSSDRTLTKAIPLHAMGEHLFSGRSALEITEVGK